MKTVLHILSTNKYSGAENVAIQIIKGTQYKYNNIYCSVNGPIKSKLVQEKVKYCLLEKVNLKNIKNAIKTTKPDIIHAHDVKASLLCSIIKRNQKLIVHIHNNDPLFKKFCIKSIALLFCCIKSNRVLTVSRSIENEFCFKNKIIKNKIKCIDNPNSIKSIKSRLTNNNIETYDICVVARIAKQKNPDRFCKIIEEIKKQGINVKCKWVGDGPMRAKLEQNITDKKLRNNIELVGYKDNPYNYIDKARMLVLTSSFEGYGLVAFEALALGKPCIVSNVGGLKDIVNKKCGSLCNTNEDFIQSIVALLSRKDIYETKSKCAIERAKQLDNYDKYINTIINTYEEA